MCYKIACLGVTEQDWWALGIEALKNFNFDMAWKAFIRIWDLKFIDLVDKTDIQYSRKQVNAKQIEARILCYQGKYKEAAVLFVKNGAPKEALDMYTTLNMFKDAQELVKTIQEEGGEAI